jgi:hypothetical protein
MPDKKKETFIKRTQERIKKAADPIVLELLARMVKEEIAAHDIFYIDARTRQILEEKLGDLEYFNLEIQKLRKDLLEKNVEKATKVKVKREKATGETEKRDKRCEDVAQFLANRIIALSLSDPEYLNDAIEDDDELLAKSRVLSLVEGITESATYSINQGLMKANKKFWGKIKEEITMKQIDEFLK